jgi:hypothetical protein
VALRDFKICNKLYRFVLIIVPFGFIAHTYGKIEGLSAKACNAPASTRSILYTKSFSIQCRYIPVNGYTVGNMVLILLIVTACYRYRYTCTICKRTLTTHAHWKKTTYQVIVFCKRNLYRHPSVILPNFNNILFG